MSCCRKSLKDVSANVAHFRKQFCLQSITTVNTHWKKVPCLLPERLINNMQDTASFSIPPVVTWWRQSLHYKLSNVNYASNVWLVADNYYGTPKPPAEPSTLLLNVAEQLLPGATPRSQGKRRRNKSVSNMEKAGIEPPEEEEEERPVINGNGVAITPGEELSISLRRREILSCAALQCSKSSYCCDLRSGLLA